MSRWYRAYEGTVTDAKLGEVALVAECSRSVAIATWHCILESAASVNEGGRFDCTARRIAVILGEPIATIERALAEMSAMGMISDGIVAAWRHRQFESDNSTERSRKHRERKKGDAATGCNADATLQGRDATPPYTETDTETEIVVEEGDAGASDDPPAPAEPTDGWNGDLIETADKLARLAGVPNTSPAAIARNTKTVKQWIDDGIDPDTDIAPAIQKTIAEPHDPIGTLQFFDRHVRNHKARREAHANGFNGSRHSGRKADEGGSLPTLARVALASIGTGSPR